MGLTTQLELTGPAGRLEAILMSPKTLPIAAAVVCHAHPLYGGSMNMKVVYRAAKTLQEHGAASLRFNFRGVGRSQGEHDGGRGEQDDVRVAIAEMETRFPHRPLILGGFSFGSTMALRVGADDPRVKAIFVLGFPLSLAPDVAFMRQCKKPRLFVQGERDQFGPASDIRELVDGLAEPRSLVIVPGGDHLFAGRLNELDRALARWVERRPWESPLPLDWSDSLA